MWTRAHSKPEKTPEVFLNLDFITVESKYSRRFSFTDLGLNKQIRDLGRGTLWEVKFKMAQICNWKESVVFL